VTGESVAALTARIAAEVAAAIAGEELTGDGRAPTDADRRAFALHRVAAALGDDARRRVGAGDQPLTAEQESVVRGEVLDRVLGSGPLEPLLRDPTVTDINAIGHDRVWVRRTDGTVDPGPALAASDEKLQELVRSLVRGAGSQRRFDAGAPKLDLQLPNGDRLFALMDVCPRTVLCIRRHDFTHLATLDQQVDAGMMDPLVAEFLAAAVRARRNVVVSGGMGAGKTTVVRGLCNEIPAHERIVTVEDSYELGLDRFPDRHPQVVPLQVREHNVEREGAIGMTELTRWALRASADRVIVGEVRGAEVIPMLQAMNLGSDGSMCTVHASSSQAAFDKLATYAATPPGSMPVEVANQWIKTGVHLVVHISADLAAGQKPQRFVSSIREVTGAEGLLVSSNEIFGPGPDGRATPRVPPRPALLADLAHAGFDEQLLADAAGWSR